MSFKNGFTLSEVLITLGIIGVISAMTLPSVINHFQMKSYAVSFKKHYSILQNTINYLQAEENIKNCYVYYPTGSSMYMYATEDCANIKNEIVNKLQLTQINYDCSIYNSQENVLSNGGKTKNNSVHYEEYLPNAKAYLFKDGAILLFGYSGVSYGQGNAFWVLDVNGQKGPNKWGYDVFFMTLTQGSNGQIKLGDALASIKEKGGYYPSEMLLK